MLSEINLSNEFVGSQLFGRTIPENFAFKHQICPVGDRKRFLNIVVSDQDADVFGFEFGDDVLNVLYCNGVNTGKGFIEQDKLGIGSQ